MKPIPIQTLKAGSLAFLDTFAGLVPCKVLSVQQGLVQVEATIKLTAERKAYKRGETLTQWVRHVIPRKSIKHSAYGAKIMPYRVEIDSAPLPR